MDRGEYLSRLIQFYAMAEFNDRKENEDFVEKSTREMVKFGTRKNIRGGQRISYKRRTYTRLNPRGRQKAEESFSFYINRTMNENGGTSYMCFLPTSKFKKDPNSPKKDSYTNEAIKKAIEKWKAYYDLKVKVTKK